MNQRRVTSKDIADRAGVSQSTVSRVLSSNETSSFISKETADRVREIASELGYSPNPIARALRGERTNMVGLIVREITDPFFAGLIEIVNNEARKKNMNVVLGYARSDPGEGVQMARVLDSRQVDGVIFLGDLRNDKEVLKAYVREDHPMVALCRGRKIPGLPNINVDNRAGIRLLINHLKDLGHQRIVFIDGGWFGDVLERREEFLRIKEEDPLCKDFSWIQAEDDDFKGGYGVIEELLALDRRPTAVIGSSDTLAIGLMKAAQERNLRIPQDLSIVGFDDITLAKFVSPSLTTIRQPIEEMGKKAVEIIDRQINKEKIPENESCIELEPKLIIRNTTCKVSK